MDTHRAAATTSWKVPAGSEVAPPRAPAQNSSAWNDPSGMTTMQPVTGGRAERRRAAAYRDEYPDTTVPPSMSRPARNIHHPVGGPWLVRTVFWLGLILSVVPWWLTTAQPSLVDAGAALTAAGRITGLIGGYLLIVQVLMTSRLTVLERWVGARDLLIWHRELGAGVVIMILGHAALITLGYSWTDNVSLFAETTTLLTTYTDMLSAYVATAILVAIGLLAIRGLRRVMPHELWRTLHMATYLILFLGYGHQFSNGEQLARPGFGKYWWIGMYLFSIAAVLYGRVIAPIRLNMRHSFRVLSVVEEAAGTYSLYVGGSRMDRFDAKAGQFCRWRFMIPGMWWQSHPFSLSEAPNGQWLRLTVKAVGGYTSRLPMVARGTRVIIQGPAGDFTAERRHKPSALLIAAGSGIAPIRALLEELPERAVVIYRAGDVADLAFRDELEQLAHARLAAIRYVIGPRNGPDAREVFSPLGLKALVPDIPDRDVYLCGPRGFVDQTMNLLRKCRVPRKQVHLDPFEF